MVRSRGWNAALLAGGALGSWGALALLLALGTPASLFHRGLFFLALFCGAATSVGLLAYLLSFRIYHYRRQQGDLGLALYQGVSAALVLVVAFSLYLLEYLTVSSGLLLTAAAGALQVVGWPRPRSTTRRKR